jgi:serine/threonine protein kinase/TolA-binding protein
MTASRAVHERRLRIGQVLEEAVPLLPQDRAAFLRKRLADPEELEEALGLLSLYPEGVATGPISRAVGTAFLRSSNARRQGLLGQVIAGRYRIVSVLGHGGSGTVYLAERADKQYSAQVAVKIIDEGAATTFGQRFRAERQILASLNHPNIARLLDAGETEEHQPYLVMEYIHGEPVDQYCDQQQLDLRARLELFLQICQAVQYAHQNLIVHRDIKPANILVTNEGAPKLLDFGIAKLLDASDITKASDLTRMNDRLLTPEYASPEQILGRPVTTASDVYSLGVVLYQLLTGLRPYTLSSSAASQLELERSICVTDPLRPSAAVHAARTSEPGNDDPSIFALASARSTTPEKLERSLAGDLDAIVMRALRKEPQHRYTSIDQFIGDIRHFLANEPVQARQGNWAYYASRFIRRNRLAVAAGTTVAALIVASLITVSIQRAAVEEALALAMEKQKTSERVSAYLRDIFAAANPYVNFGRELTARELLDQASRVIETDDDLQKELNVKAAIYESMGISYRRLGVPNEAVAKLEAALRIRRKLNPKPNHTIVANLIELAIAQRDAGQAEQSDAHFTEAQQMMASLGNVDPEAEAKVLVEIGRLETSRSRPGEALRAFTKALDLMRSVKGPRDPEVGSILSELANIYTWMDQDIARAEAVAREAVEIYQSVDVLHPDRVKGDFILAETLLYQGKLAEAAPIYERTLAAQRVLFKENAAVAETMSSLAQVRMAQGDAAAAERLVREALMIHHNANSTAYAKVGFLQTLLGTLLIQQSRFAEAEPVLREALDLFARSLPPDHQYVASAEHYLGEALAGQGNHADAETYFTAATLRWMRTSAPEWRAARSASALGEVLYKEGRIEEAERKLVDSYRILVIAEGVDPATREMARERVIRFFNETRQKSKLEALMREFHPTVNGSATADRSL